MISNLPIMHREEIKLVILHSPHSKVVNILGSDGYCNSNELLTPSFYPINGEYNDYGTIENIRKDWSNDFLDEFLKKNYPKISVEGKIVEVNVDNFIRGIERGSLILYRKDDVVVDDPYSFVMIRKDIWDGIVETQMYKKIYWNDRRVSISDEYRIDAITYLERNVEKVLNVPKELDDLGIMLKYSLGDMFYSYETHLNVKCGYPTFLFHNILTNENLKRDYIELIIIQNFLDSTRKGWMIQPGKGAQNSDVELYLELNKLIEKSCEIIKNRFNEDEDEE
jgi:hypothetical protein